MLLAVSATIMRGPVPRLGPAIQPASRAPTKESDRQDQGPIAHSIAQILPMRFAARVWHTGLQWVSAADAEEPDRPRFGMRETPAALKTLWPSEGKLGYTKQ